MVLLAGLILLALLGLSLSPPCCCLKGWKLLSWAICVARPPSAMGGGRGLSHWAWVFSCHRVQSTDLLDCAKAASLGDQPTRQFPSAEWGLGQPTGALKANRAPCSVLL